MGRGLDGFLRDTPPERIRCAVFRAPERWSRRLSVALARGKHLFPFRTEQLSLSAPMVLGPQGPGRVGRRRFLHTRRRPSGGGVLSFQDGFDVDVLHISPTPREECGGRVLEGLV